MTYKVTRFQRDAARDLRRKMTDAEKRLWRALRAGQLGVKFRRQAPVGPYIADFLCHERHLIVELDGGQHAVAAEADARRTDFLEAKGYRVLRFWNDEVLSNKEGVLMTIRDKLNASPPPILSPQAGGGSARRSAGCASPSLLAEDRTAGSGPQRAMSLEACSIGSDAVTLAYADRYRRRGRLTTDAGEAILLDLPEATELRDDAALVLEDGRRIRIRAAPEPLAQARGTDPVHLARLAWHVGNRHTPAQIDGDRLLILRDHVLEDMLRGLGAEVAHVEAPFRPEGGAYGHGRTHGHSHGHDPAADPNAHIPHRHD